jgi:tRNA(Phe) wybutosine-synthesizing methylase Tyw3
MRHPPLATSRPQKGSVDACIQALVDLINHHHPLFSTISSCSGQISLFDLNGVSNGVDEELPCGMKATTNSGKGQGCHPGCCW